jgi:phosphohistidine phosphatase
MIVYLVRHGKAEAGDDDDLRRLTAAGQKAVRRVAQALADAGVRPERIEHSGLTRARETAEIIAGATGAPVAAASGLRPEAAVEPVARRLAGSREESLMLVGHQPFMGRLASYLLTGDAEAGLLHFRTSAVACLELDGGAWVLGWFLPPNLA